MFLTFWRLASDRCVTYRLFTFGRKRRRVWTSHTKRVLDGVRGSVCGVRRARWCVWGVDPAVEFFLARWRREKSKRQSESGDETQTWAFLLASLGPFDMCLFKRPGGQSRDARRRLDFGRAGAGARWFTGRRRAGRRRPWEAWKADTQCEESLCQCHFRARFSSRDSTTWYRPGVPRLG